MKIFLKAFILLIGFSLNAQILDPIDWSHQINKVSDDEFELVFIADMDEGWHIYSQYPEIEDDGPIATEIIFMDATGNYSLIGKTTEPPTEPVYEEAFDMEVKYFGGKAEFKQRIKILNPDLALIKAEVNWQICDDKRCLAPDMEEIAFNLNPDAKAAEVEGSVTLDDIKKSSALDLKVTGWENFEQEEVSKKSNFTIFLLGFLGGLIAL
ncbi:MAG: hypothetical protein EX254_10235, partial [Flavobacteriaceae bacterium]